MSDKASGNAALTLGTIIFFIRITVNRQRRGFNRIILDVMVRLVQRICIGFDLGIKSTKVLASGVVYFNVIRRIGRLIVVVERLARYQLVGNRSICGSSGRACSE